jgi:hypothetical protein
VNSAAVTAAIAVSAAESIATAVSITAAEPGTGPDEEPAGEPCRTVVAVRSAGVRIVGIVAIRADGSRVRGIVVDVVARVGLRTGVDLRLGITLRLLRITLRAGVALAVIVSRSAIIRSALVSLRAVGLAAVDLFLGRKRRRRDSDGKRGNE